MKTHPLPPLHFISFRISRSACAKQITVMLMMMMVVTMTMTVLPVQGKVWNSHLGGAVGSPPALEFSKTSLRPGPANCPAQTFFLKTTLLLNGLKYCSHNFHKALHISLSFCSCSYDKTQHVLFLNESGSEYIQILSLGRIGTVLELLRYALCGAGLMLQVTGSCSARTRSELAQLFLF